MSAIENKKIKFFNKVINGTSYKYATSEINDPDHITDIKSIITLNEHIANIELAINGNFELIEDPDFTAGEQIAYITETNIEFYNQDAQNIIDYGSLQDFLELLIAWRDFLMEPPLQGTKVNDGGNNV